MLSAGLAVVDALSEISPSSGAGRLSDAEGDVGVAGVCDNVALTAEKRLASVRSHWRRSQMLGST